MLGHFDEIYRRLERLEQEYHTITQALRRVEAGLAGGRGRREVLERDLAALKRHAAALQSRIEEIAQRLGRQRARPLQPRFDHLDAAESLQDLRVLAKVGKPLAPAQTADKQVVGLAAPGCGVPRGPWTRA